MGNIQKQKQKRMINEKENQEKPQGGFFDLPKWNQCKHPEHNPPCHLYIPPGKGYIHVCPCCGEKTTIIPQQISFKHAG